MVQPALAVTDDAPGPRPQPLVQLRPAPPAGDVANGDGDRLLLTDQDHEAFAAGDAGVEKIPLQHGVVLGHDRDNHSRVLRALALMDGRGIGRYQGVELAKAVGDPTAVKAGAEFAGIGIDVVDIAMSPL